MARIRSDCEIQFIVGPLDEYAFGIERGPHRAVAKNGRPLNPGEKVSRNTLCRQERCAGLIEQVCSNVRLWYWLTITTPVVDAFVFIR